MPEEMLRRHRHVRLELADPDAVGPLQLEQPARAAVDRADRVRSAPRSRSCRNCCTRSAQDVLSRARPLRTALSIVAGQPVSVHAPARTTLGRLVSTPGRRRPGRSAIVAYGSRLTRDQRSSASPSRSVSCAGDPLDELAAAHLEQLGHAARDDGQVLAALGRVPGERAAVEDPVRIGAEQRGERRRQQRRSNQRWTLTIGESSSSRLRLAEQARALARRHGDDDRVGVEVVERLDALVEPHAVAEHPPRGVAVHRSRAASSGSTRSALPRGPSSAVRTVKSPAPASTSSARRLSAGRMKTSQNRSTAASARAEPAQHAPNVSPGRGFAPLAARSVTSGMRRRSRSGTCAVARAAPAGSARFGARAVLGEHRQREPRAQIRAALADALEEAEYSVKQPSAMCCPLSGGGSGSPSRSGSVCTAPPSVGRASYSVTSTPASSELERGGEPGEPAADDRRLHRRAPATTRELLARREPARRAEHVEAVRLHAVELPAVEAGERRHAERAPPVERVEQPQPLLEMRARALRLERHEGSHSGVTRSSSPTPNRSSSSCGR